MTPALPILAFTATNCDWPVQLCVMCITSSPHTASLLSSGTSGQSQQAELEVMSQPRCCCGWSVLHFLSGEIYNIFNRELCGTPCRNSMKDWESKKVFPVLFTKTVCWCSQFCSHVTDSNTTLYLKFPWRTTTDSSDFKIAVHKFARVS